MRHHNNLYFIIELQKQQFDKIILFCQSKCEKVNFYTILGQLNKLEKTNEYSMRYPKIYGPQTTGGQGWGTKEPSSKPRIQQDKVYNGPRGILLNIKVVNKRLYKSNKNSLIRTYFLI